MPYIKRGKDGSIQALSFTKSDECNELLDNEGEVIKVISSLLNNKGLETITSDLAMVRVIEDLIGVLVARSLISISDFPQKVQLKLLARDSLRKSGNLSIGSTDLIKL